MGVGTRAESRTGKGQNDSFRTRKQLCGYPHRGFESHPLGAMDCNIYLSLLGNQARAKSMPHVLPLISAAWPWARAASHPLAPQLR
jgi:hypothetical protein